jgi:hypothetical protein
MRWIPCAVGIGLSVAAAAPAWADDARLEARLARVERELAARAAPSGRETQSAVDAYLASASADASLVAGPGAAGFDKGFWIRGGPFLIKPHLTIQARYEAFDWDDTAAESENGDLSGWSVPRTTLRLVGEAACSVRWWVEIEFGHHGDVNDVANNALALGNYLGGAYGAGGDSHAATVYEAWVEYEWCPWFVAQMGLVKTPATRQLWVPPEKQQFVDVSLATAFVGTVMPGYAGRNWDYGVFLHGAFDCPDTVSYQAAITNGDGFPRRNLFDGETSDNLAYSARVNWDHRGRIGYEEGALRQNECEWCAAVGAWIHHYADAAGDHPHVKFADRTTWGVDLAAGWGGFSLTAAYSGVTFEQSGVGVEFEGSAWLVQLGYLICGTPFEVAARYDRYALDDASGFLAGPTGDYGATECAAAVNYYLDGHNDKLTLDVSFIQADDNGNPMADLYAGYHVTGASDATLVRFQWQLFL